MDMMSTKLKPDFPQQFLVSRVAAKRVKHPMAVQPGGLSVQYRLIRDLSKVLLEKFLGHLHQEAIRPGLTKRRFI